MKILHVITSLNTGGAEKLLTDLLPRLKADGCDVELFVFNGIKTPFYKKLCNAGVKIHSYGSGSVYNPIHIYRLYKLLRQGNFDIIHTHNTSPQLFAAIDSLFCSVTLCTTEHSTSNRRRRWVWYRLVDRWMYGRYNKIIACSEKTSQNLNNYICSLKDKIITINNGIPIEKFINAPEITNFRSGLPRNSRIITMVAGFRWEKDQATLIRSLKVLPSNFFLFLVGDGVQRTELEDICKSIGVEDRVKFLGIRSDVPNILHSSDYIAMSSHFEGLSLSSVEGMSVGKPMLASDVLGLREVVCGAGLLFKHAEPNDFAKKILELEYAPVLYETIAAKCLERAKLYDINKMVDGYKSVYMEVLDEDN